MFFFLTRKFVFVVVLKFCSHQIWHCSMAVWAIDMFFDAVCIENKLVVIYGLSPDVQIIFIHNLLFLYDFICILYFWCRAYDTFVQCNDILCFNVGDYIVKCMTYKCKIYSKKRHYKMHTRKKWKGFMNYVTPYFISYRVTSVNINGNSSQWNMITGMLMYCISDVTI